MTKEQLLFAIRLLLLEVRLFEIIGDSKDDIKELMRLAKEAYLKDERDENLDILKEVLYHLLKHDFKTMISKSIIMVGLEDSVGEKNAKAIMDIDDDVDFLQKEAFSLRKRLSKELKKARVINIIGKTNYYLRSNRNIEDDEFSQASDKLLEVLEGNQVNVDADSAVNDEFTISSTKIDDLTAMFRTIVDDSSMKGVWRTQHPEMDDMLQGGFRDGQLAVINGLQHSYKSGFTLSTFISLLLLNKPKPSKRKGKPTAVWLSMEDDMRKVMGDVYGILKVFDNPNHPRIKLEDEDPEEMAKYVTQRLEDTGYDVKFFRIDSSDYSYKALFEFLTKIEMKGGSIRITGIDYIANIPKTGCSTTGATGADTRELFRRIRNWVQARGILTLSPHQLNTQAKQMIKDGLPRHELVPRVLKNGYSADSSQIDQELDIELCVNPFEKDGKDYLMIGCGKHKLNSVIEDKRKLIFILPFPENGNKIPPNLGNPYNWHSYDDVVVY